MRPTNDFYESVFPKNLGFIWEMNEIILNTLSNSVDDDDVLDYKLETENILDEIYWKQKNWKSKRIFFEISILYN